MKPPTSLSVRQVANMLGVPLAKVYALISAGQLQAFNTTINPRPTRHRWRITMDAIAEFQQRRANPPPVKVERRRRRASYQRMF